MSNALKVHIETTTELSKQPHRPSNWLSTGTPTCKQHKAPQRPHRPTLCKKHPGIACTHSQMLFDKIGPLSYSLEVPLLSHTLVNRKDTMSRSSCSNPVTTQADPSLFMMEVLHLRLQEANLVTTSHPPHWSSVLLNTWHQPGVPQLETSATRDSTSTATSMTSSVRDDSSVEKRSTTATHHRTNDQHQLVLTTCPKTNLTASGTEPIHTDLGLFLTLALDGMTVVTTTTTTAIVAAVPAPRRRDGMLDDQTIKSTVTTADGQKFLIAAPIAPDAAPMPGIVGTTAATSLVQQPQASQAQQQPSQASPSSLHPLPVWALSITKHHELLLIQLGWVGQRWAAPTLCLWPTNPYKRSWGRDTKVCLLKFHLSSHMLPT